MGHFLWSFSLNRATKCEARAKFHKSQGNKRRSKFWDSRNLYYLARADYYR